MELGDTRLATVTDTVPARYTLDDVYDRTLAYCLGQGFWDFAMKNVPIASSGAPAFGYAFQFTKPADWVRTAAISTVVTFIPPLGDYVDEVSLWKANTTPIYVRYVSNNASFGMDLTIWPEAFTRYVELELAWRIAKRVNQSSEDRKILHDDLLEAKQIALLTDAKLSVPLSGPWAQAQQQA